MDIQLLYRVLDRHRSVVAVGLGLAVLLALLSYGRPAMEGWKPVLKHREQEQWQSQARIFVTLPGFPSGRSLLRPGAVRGGSTADSIQRAESRLGALALLYAGLATGDDVTKIVRREGPIRGRVVTAAATVSGGSATLPIVDVTAIAPSGPGSRALANRYANALKRYVRREQTANGVPPAERVDLQLLNQAGRTQLVDPRGKTLPMIVFLSLLSATIGLALALENLRQRVPSVIKLESRLDPPARVGRLAKPQVEPRLDQPESEPQHDAPQRHWA